MDRFPLWLRCFLMLNAGLLLAVGVRCAQVDSIWTALFCGLSTFNGLVAMCDR